MKKGREKPRAGWPVQRFGSEAPRTTVRIAEGPTPHQAIRSPAEGPEFAS